MFRGVQGDDSTGGITNNRFGTSTTVGLIGRELTYTIDAAKYGAALTSPKIQVSLG